MAPEKISGRIGCRIVGIIELLLAFAWLGSFIWYLLLDHYWDDNNNNNCVYCQLIPPKHHLQGCQLCLLLQVIFLGVYFIFGICMAAGLILSTFSTIGLNGRKWIAVSWCLFNMVSFIGAVIVICISKLCQEFTWFLLMVGFLVKMAVFFCIVCTYVWGISETIMNKKLYAMPMSPVHVKGRRAGI